MEVVTFTSQGRKRFGEKLFKYRDDRKWSLGKAVESINSKLGTNLSKSALNDIENGIVKQIKVDTLLLISQSGYGDMGFSEMVDILTERRLSLCEKGSDYRVCSNEAIAV